MPLSRFVSVLVLLASSLVVTGCGALTRGLGGVTSEGLVDEYSIPQNRGLAVPTDFSRLPTPLNPRDVRASLPSQAEIESLMFTLEPEPEPEYVPMTVVTGEVPDYQPIGRIVASGSNGAASQEFVSPQTNAAGSLFPVLNQPASAPALTISPALAPVPQTAPMESAGVGEGVVVLSAEDAAALSALAIGAPISNLPPAAAAIRAAPMVTSLPDGVTVVGAPVVLQR